MVDYCFESTRRIIIIKISDCDHIRFKEDLPVIVEYLHSCSVVFLVPLLCYLLIMLSLKTANTICVRLLSLSNLFEENMFLESKNSYQNVS